MSVASLPAENNFVRYLRSAWRQLYLPLLGIFTALVLGALVILVSGFDPIKAYQGLWEGRLATSAS